MKKDYLVLNATKWFAIWLCVLALLLTVITSGCRTTRTPQPVGEPVVTTTIDVDTALVIAELVLRIEQVAFNQWLALARQNAELSIAEFEVQSAVWSDRIESFANRVQALAEARAAME